MISIDGSWFLFTENLYSCVVIAFIRLHFWFHHMITNDIENNNIKTMSLQVNFCRDYKQICWGISRHLKFLKLSHVNHADWHIKCFAFKIDLIDLIHLIELMSKLDLSCLLHPLEMIGKAWKAFVSIQLLLQAFLQFYSLKVDH